MNKKTLSIIVVAVLAFFSSCSHPSNEFGSLSSPNTYLKIEIGQCCGSLCYVVLDKNDTIIQCSPLGLMRDSIDFSKGLKFIGQSTSQTIEDNYSLIVGKQKEVKSKFNFSKFTFEKAGQTIELLVRVYDEGVAFGYNFPNTDSAQHIINAEYSGFNLPDSGKCWMAYYDKVTQWSPGYETAYSNGIAIGDSSPGKEGWAFPLLFNANKHWVLISEAGLDETYCASHVQQKAENGLYKIRFPEYNEAYDSLRQLPVSTLPWQTPWRFIVIGQKLNTIVETNMPTNLAAPAKFNEVSWVQPGISSWSWWGNPPSSKQYKPLAEFVDFSKEMGWKYSLVDANWNIMTGGNIEQLAQYAKLQNVGLLMWYNSGGPTNIVTEQPRDIMNNPMKRKEEFKKLAAWGIKGIKVDFFQSDKQFIIAEYMGILKDAAENQIMVNFHGCTLPRGWQRTWPNLVSMEAVRGAETYGFNEKYPQQVPSQNCIHPFVRNAVGPMDFTPVTFGDQKFAHLTTNAHELAMSVVFQSGIVHMADRVTEYKKQVLAVIEYLKNVPAQFDETRFIEGYPGKYVVIARRIGQTWYVGGFNGQNNPLEINIQLPFAKDKKVQLFTDGANARTIAVSDTTLEGSELLPIKFAPFGGFVAVVK